MKVIRTTLVQPRKGYERQVAGLLHELGDCMSTQPGFIEEYEAHGERDTFGRVSVWESREAAHRAATPVRTLSLRSRLNHTTARREERLMEVDRERHAEAVGV